MENIESLYAEAIQNQMGAVVMISTVICILVLFMWYLGIKSHPRFHWLTFVRAIFPALFFGVVIALQFFHVGYTQAAFEELWPQQAPLYAEKIESELYWYIIRSMVLMYVLCVTLAWFVSLFKRNNPKSATA